MRAISIFITSELPPAMPFGRYIKWSASLDQSEADAYWRSQLSDVSGATRLGVCDASGCSHVFVDTSPNQSRRYCSDRCSSRANVAAYRARQRESRMAAS